jgi:prepilin peptidase CpaA
VALEWALVAVLPLGVLYASLRDLVSYEIPNWLSLAIAAAMIPAMLGAGIGWATVGLNLAAGVCTLGVGIFLFARGYMGGGDVKLMAATVLWMGWPLLAEFVVLVALFGGALALVVLGFRRLPLPSSWAGHPWLQRLYGAESGIPYGVAIGAATLCLLPYLDVVRILRP